MKISDLVSMCLGNLFRRKTRTLLTIIGIVVGTCAIVVMISMGVGMNLSQEAMLAQMGDLTLIRVYNWNSSNKDLVLDDAIVAKFQAMAGVDVATPIYNPNFQVRVFGGKKDRYKMEYLNIVGMYSSAMSKMGYQLLEGEYPAGPTVSAKKPLNVLSGEYTAYNFQDTKKKYDNQIWPEPDPMTGKIKGPFIDLMTNDLTLKTYNWDEDSSKDNSATTVTRELKVVGRIKEDYNKGYETSRGLLMDINDVKKLEEEYNKKNKVRSDSNGKKGYNQVTVKVASIDDVDPVETLIKELGFETESMETVRKPMQAQVRQQQMFLGGLAGISLLVAAIGIINTMFMSIYERTREIGIMKVLGCHMNNIRTLFLMEAGVIGFVGGCVGVVISYGLSYVMNYFNFSFNGGSGMNGGIGGMYSGGMMMGGMGMGGEAASGALPVSVIPLWLVGAAILFATLVGVLSGILPANRAMKISALEAIKHE